ncbi:MAG: hypothetical protein C0625_04090 [Arcobacter sp.]|nr:MAG: hypothetical protein C0625_04090 [Arcobacter sp.]
MNKKTILGAGIVIALALAPIGIKNMADATIDLEKSKLDKKGLLLSIDSSEGYITTTRDFTLTIKDEKKFKEYFKNIILAKYPAYEPFITGFTKNDTNKFDEFLKGIVFKGNIENTNINPFSDIKAYTYLNKFSDEIMSKIKNDEEGSKIILPLLEKETLAFNMTFDRKTKLKTLSLKDINENIKRTFNSGKNLDGTFQILGYKIVNNSSEKMIIADAKLDKISMNVKGEVSASINNIKSNISYENQFLNNGKTEIGSINFNFDNKVINLENTKLSSSGFITNEIYSADTKISTENFKLANGSNKTVFDNLDLYLDLNDLDYKNLEKLNKAYMDYESASIQSMYLPEDEKNNKMVAALKPLVTEVNSLLNNGLSLKLDANLLGLKDEKINLKNVKLDVDARLGKNDLNIESLNKSTLLTLLNVKANLQMLEEDYINLSAIIPPQFANLISMYAKKENDKVLFNLDLKKGKIEVNGQEVN